MTINHTITVLEARKIIENTESVIPIASQHSRFTKQISLNLMTKMFVVETNVGSKIENQISNAKTYDNINDAVEAYNDIYVCW